MFRFLLVVAIVSALVQMAFVATMLATPPQTQGFFLRGVLEDATSDGTGYFKIGEALVLAIPHKDNSALVPGLKNLVGKRVVISVLPDDSQPK